MKNDTSFKTILLTIVLALHGGIIAWAWQKTVKQPEVVNINNLAFVDLNTLPSSAKSDDGAASAKKVSVTKNRPTAPSTQSAPKKSKSPASNRTNIASFKEQPKLTTVERDKKTADIIQPKLKPKKSIEKIVKKSENVDIVPPVNPKVEKNIEPKKQPIREKSQHKIIKSNRLLEKTDKVVNPEDAKAISANQMDFNSNLSGQNNLKTGQVNAANINAKNAHSDVNADGKRNKQQGGVGSSNKVDRAKSTIVDGGYLKKPALKYPIDAQEANQEGKVVLIVTVEPNGTVSNVEIKKSSRYSSLDREAKRSAKAAKYSPSVNDGVPMRTRFTVEILFKLE